MRLGFIRRKKTPEETEEQTALKTAEEAAEMTEEPASDEIEEREEEASRYETDSEEQTEESQEFDEDLEDDDDEDEVDKPKKHRIRTAAHAVLNGIRRVPHWCRTHQDFLRSAGIGVLTLCLIGQSGMIWSQGLKKDSAPRGTIAHAVIRWLDHHGAGVQSETIEPAAYPVKMAVRNEQGLYGIQYSTAGVASAFQLTEDLWSIALDRCEAFAEANETDYAEAMQNSILFAEFDGSVPLSLLAGWLDAGLPANEEDRTCGALLLTREGDDTYRLYLRDAKDGALYSAATTVTDIQFDSAAASFAANGCTMAADTDTVIAPETLQFTDPQSFDTVVMQPYTGSMDGLLEALSIDGQAAQETAYTTTDGTTVYVGEDAAVRVTQQGVLTYQSDTGIAAYKSGLRSEDQNQKNAQLGHALSQALLEAMNSGGEAHLIKAYTDSQDRYITVFALRIDGVPVDNELGYFARYVFDDGAMTHADVVLRSCEVTGGSVVVMPETVAASARNDATALLSLRYTDTVSILEDGEWGEGQNTDGTLSTDTGLADDSWVTDPAVPEDTTQWDTTGLNGTTVDSTGAGTDPTASTVITDPNSTSADTGVYGTDPAASTVTTDMNGTVSDPNAVGATIASDPYGTNPNGMPYDTAYGIDTGMGSTLSVGGDTVTMQAQWKFVLYEKEAYQDELTEEELTQMRGQTELAPEDIVCHMPDLLTPLGEGGAGK